MSDVITSRAVSNLHADLQPLVYTFLQTVAEAGVEVLVTCTTRSLKDQEALYAQGRSTPGHIVTNARAGQSAHNYGLAIDVVPLVNGKPDWDGTHPAWEALGRIGQSVGLEWAGEPGFPFPERPHFQHRNWRMIAGV
jgi:peptidoglycan LD-endopeptidase CwlK